MMGIPSDLKQLLIAYERRILALEEELEAVKATLAESTPTRKKTATKTFTSKS